MLIVSVHSSRFEGNVPNFSKGLLELFDFCLKENFDLSGSLSLQKSQGSLKLKLQSSDLVDLVVKNRFVFCAAFKNMFLIIQGPLRSGGRQLFRLSVCPLVCFPRLPGMLTCISSSLLLFFLTVPPPPPPSLTFLWM